MLKFTDMATGEMQALLLRNSFGHLGCTRDNHSYVVPMHYACDRESLYFFTTEGTKTEFIAANTEVCFQVEEITDASRWLSVMLIGDAQRITKQDQTERAMQLITERNPMLMPAISRTEIGAWTRLSKVALYRVCPSAIYGRKTI